EDASGRCFAAGAGPRDGDLGAVDAVDAGGEVVGGDTVEVQRYDPRASAVRDTMNRLLLEIRVGEIAGPVEARAPDGQVLVELVLGELAFRDAIHAPDVVSVHRAHLAGKPGDRRDDERVL